MGRRTSRRGFTLVELMIVIVILGVLTVLALAGYRLVVLVNRSAEAVQFLGAMRAAQAAYFQVNGVYCGDQQAAVHPAGFAFTKKLPWNTKDMPDAWRDLALRPSSAARSQYRLRAGPAGSAPAPLPDGWKAPWYVVSAHSDFDNDGKHSTFEITAATDQVHGIREGE